MRRHAPVGTLAQIFTGARLWCALRGRAKTGRNRLEGRANRGALASLLQLVPSTQILFGTDFPPGGSSREVARLLADVRMFEASDLRAIDRENAVRLLPRLG